MLEQQITDAFQTAAADAQKEADKFSRTIEVISNNFVSAMLLSRLNEQEGPQGRLEMVKDFTDFIVNIAVSIPSKEPLASIGINAVDTLCMALSFVVEDEPLVPGDFGTRLNQALQQSQAGQSSRSPSFNGPSAPIPKEFGAPAQFRASPAPVLNGPASFKL